MARGRTLLKRLASFAFIPLFLILVLGDIAYSIQTPVVSGLPALPGAQAPATPSADQVAMTKAAGTNGGQDLKGKGYTATEVIDNESLTKWLGEQEGHEGISSSGPYVLFSKSTRQAGKPDPSVEPGVLVDVNQGLEVAVYQTYSDNRGAACYNGGDVKDIRTIEGQTWVFINIYLWHKSLDDSYEVTRDDLPQLPSSVKTVRCYTFAP
jgi:hypothetical protein